MHAGSRLKAQAPAAGARHNCWAAVKQFIRIYYNMETLSFTMFPEYGNYVP